MHTIQLNQLLPQVFAQMPDLVSEVWRQDVTLEKGKAYLIEASSGTGKSTLCSYLLGYRRDYAGHLRFDNRDARTLSSGRRCARATLANSFRNCASSPN